MSVYDFAGLAVAAVVPVLGEPAVYTPRGTDVAVTVRAIPDQEKEDMSGADGRRMFRDRRTFLVAEADFAGAVPSSGDTLTIRGERWRIAEAAPIHPAAPMWSLQCQAMPPA